MLDTVTRLQDLRAPPGDRLDASVYALAKAIHVALSRINEISHGRQGVTPAIALRLGRFFGVDPQGITKMQAKYDLHVQAERLKGEVEAIEPRQVA